MMLRSTGLMPTNPRMLRFDTADAVGAEIEAVEECGHAHRYDDVRGPALEALFGHALRFGLKGEPWTHYLFEETLEAGG